MTDDPKTYRCAHCGKTFDEGWSDEEAKAELAETFPGFAPEDCDLVCDDCFRKLMDAMAATPGNIVRRKPDR